MLPLSQPPSSHPGGAYRLHMGTWPIHSLLPPPKTWLQQVSPLRLHHVVHSVQNHPTNITKTLSFLPSQPNLLRSPISLQRHGKCLGKSSQASSPSSSRTLPSRLCRHHPVQTALVKVINDFCAAKATGEVLALTLLDLTAVALGTGVTPSSMTAFSLASQMPHLPGSPLPQGLPFPAFRLTQPLSQRFHSTLRTFKDLTFLSSAQASPVNSKCFNLPCLQWFSKSFTNLTPMNKPDS